MPPRRRGRRPLLERLLERVTVDSNDCWIFGGNLSPDGYGRLRDESRRTVRAHRAAYTELVGPIPEGLELDHLCRVRSCVNPAHLEPVTGKVNAERGVASRRAEGLIRTSHCTKGHAFTPENTYVDPRGARACRICKRANDVRRRAAKKKTT